MPENKTKKKRGPKTKKTDERIAILLEALNSYMPLDMACHFAQIDYSTLWRWCQADENLAMRINFARASVVRGLIRKVLKTDPQGPWKVLQALDRRNFGNKTSGPPEEAPRELHEYDQEDTKLLEAAAIDE